MLVLTEDEIKVIISLIIMFQADGAQWSLEGVNLTQLKKKLETSHENN